MSDGTCSDHAMVAGGSGSAGRWPAQAVLDTFQWLGSSVCLKDRLGRPTAGATTLIDVQT